jgi:hypothetical protein
MGGLIICALLYGAGVVYGIHDQKKSQEYFLIGFAPAGLVAGIVLLFTKNLDTAMFVSTIILGLEGIVFLLEGVRKP